MLRMKFIMGLLFSAMIISAQDKQETVSLWLFDEQVGLYPSQVLENSSENNLPLVLGLGGKIEEGKFGNALSTTIHDKVKLPEGELKFGLVELEPESGRNVPPLTWYNAYFAALMTSGENHLRKEVGFLKPTETKMNLGDFDWTIEFWFEPDSESQTEGTVFEIGSGPRAENEKFTRLSLSQDKSAFIFFN
ncbi:MAG: hypothetical protein U5K00_15960 [Melioribacteraceae bacterium]|nr:hypothetical protein [Melioribacteraceae bacterium]